MTIKQANKDGISGYLVYVSYRSKQKSNIRAQRKRFCKTKAEASKVERLLKEEVIYQVSKQEGYGKRFGEIIEEWYVYATFTPDCGVSYESREDYYAALKNWYSHLIKTPAKEVTKADIKRVLSKANERGKSKSFQRKLKNVVNTIYKWAIEDGLLNDVSSSPAMGLSISKKEEKRPEILTVKQARRFLEIAKNLEHPWYPIWATALLTGCRSGELLALDWDDINFESRRINVSKSYNTRRKEVKSTKAGWYRTVPMNDELYNLLLELRNSRSNNCQRVLPQFSFWMKGMQAKVLRGFLEQHGLPSVKFHTLRACFATMLLEQKVPPITVMKVCGWRDLDTMARYIRMAGLDEEGATENLKLLPDQEIADVISMTSIASE